MKPILSSITFRDASILLLVSLAFTLPIVIVGPPVGSPDLPHHLTITAAWQNAFESGTWIPEWVAAENNGYGAVNARYYPPLFHITYALFDIFVGNLGHSLFLTILLWSLIGGVGIFIWTLDVTGSRTVALASAAVFAFTPYHANQFYHSFMWAEFVSLSIVPFSFYFIRRQNIRPTASTWLGLTITAALLVLSNVPQLIVGATCLGIYFLITLEYKTALRSVLYSGTAIIVAMLLTAFFWVRVVAEVKCLYIALPNIDPLYDYRNNFLLAELNFWGGTGELTPLFGTLFLIFIVVCPAVAVVSSGSYRTLFSDRPKRAVTIVFIASTLLATFFTRWVWDAIPVLQKIQFPWRFLSIASLTCSILVGISLGFINRQTWRTARPAIFILVGSVLIMLTFTIKQDIMASTFMTNSEFNELAVKSASKIGLEHWRPTWTTKETFKNPERVSTEVDRQIAVTSWDDLSREFQISAGQATTVRTAITYFPHWKAKMNGEALQTSERGGALMVEVPESAGTVKLQFVEPQYTVVSRWVSLVSVLIFTLFVLTFYLRRRIGAGQLPVLGV
jgi:uncharacterized membrane protein